MKDSSTTHRHAVPSDPDVAVVLLSGGMDSCVTAAILREQGLTLNMLHTNYGQSTERRELQSFHDIAEHYRAERKLVLDTRFLRAIGGSSLTDSSVNIADADLDSGAIPSSYVPFRNGTILSMAASWAERIGAGVIAIGAVEEDSSGYPDCRASFFEAFQNAIDRGTRPDTSIRIETPVIDMSKADIVRKGAALNAPFALTWSCYRSESKPCGRCDSCALRKRGFDEAGIEDPLISLS